MNRVCPKDRPRVCPWDKPRFAPYVAQWKPNLSQDKFGSKAGRNILCAKSLCVKSLWALIFGTMGSAEEGVKQFLTRV